MGVMYLFKDLVNAIGIQIYERRHHVITHTSSL